MIIKKSTLYTVLVLVLIVIGGFMFFQSGGSGSSDDVNVKSDDVQNVVLGIKNYNYYPNTITVKAGMPVRISLDNSVAGCYRSFTIKELGISKNLKTPADYIEFTPTKKGTFRFACIMGMGYGTLVVE